MSMIPFIIADSTKTGFLHKSKARSDFIIIRFDIIFCRVVLQTQLGYKYVMAVEGVDKSSNIQWVMMSGSVLVMPPPSQAS